MAGGSFGSKPDPKNKYKAKGYTSEVLQNYPSKNPSQKNVLSGVLKPGESFQPNKESSSYGKDFLNNYLFKEEKVLIEKRQTNIQAEINELRKEIQNLINVTQNLDKQIENVVSENIPEGNEYQINFLVRIKNLIANFKKNISESCVWMECLNNKKKKKGNNKKKDSFWENTENNGAKYLTSGEHSASRSAN